MRAGPLSLWLVAAGVGCDENLLNPMASEQPKARAYEESGFFADGLSMWAPPAGTMAREWHLPAVELATGYLPRPGPVLSNGQVARAYLTRLPLPLSRPLLERGRDRYNVFCAACHGPLGDGDSIVARQMALRPPPSLLDYADRPPGYLFQVATSGFGLMPGYAAEMTDADRWATVAYLRVLQVSQRVRVDRLPPGVRQRLLAQPAQTQPPPAPSREVHQ